MNRLLIAAAVISLAPLAALADATPAAATAPAMECTKPDLNGTTSRMTRDTGTHNVQAEAQAYLDCLKAYAESEKAQAKVHGDAANKAINDYNGFVQEVNDFQNRPKN